MMAVKQPKITNRRNVMFAVLVATFLSAIEGTIVMIAMPRIVSDLGGVESMSWVVSIYLLTTVISTPIYGKTADLYGRKLVFTIGSVLFLIGSMLSGMSQTMMQLIVFRAIQGLGAGALLPVTLTIIGDIYPFEQRAKMQGWLSVVWGIAGVLGPLTGGVIVDLISWHWIFYINVPFGLVALIILWLSLHEDFEKKKHHIDYGGIITFSLSISAFLLALSLGGATYPWDSWTIIGLLFFSAIMFVWFIWIESKSPEPMLPLNLFTVRVILFINVTGFLISAVLIAIDFYVPLWIQGVYGQGARYAGMMLIPMTLTWSCGSIMVGRIVGRTGIRPLILFGMIMIALGSVGLATLTISSPHWMIAAFAAICGLGFGTVFTLQTLSVQTAVEWNKRGIAVASNSFMRMLGQVIGIAVFGTLLNSRMAKQLSQHGIELGDADLNQALDKVSTEATASIVEYFKEALASGLGHIFIILAVLAIIALAISLLLPKIVDGESKSEVAADRLAEEV